MAQLVPWMIYGANGYTGRRIAEEAVRRGMRPTLAGRSEQPIAALAARLNCPHTVFSLNDRAADALRGMQAVIHCAGPFSATARPMLEACLRSRTSYLDITGEIDVIEMAAARDAEARQAQIAVIPAVGFDVVPSDCLAATLKDALPRAVNLQLAFETTGGLSPGTAKTSLENLPRGGRVRKEGRIERVPTAWKTREVDFSCGRRTVVTIPWGDVASAYHSTGIPNIEVYMAMPPARVRTLQRFRWLLPLVGMKRFQRVVRRQIERHVPGPNEQELAESRGYFWGRAEDARGQAVEATLSTIGGYPLTVQTSLIYLEAALAGRLPQGFSTPSRALGKDVILSVPGSELAWIKRG